MTVTDRDSAPFWEALADGEMQLQRCPACDRLRFPPVPACPYCGHHGGEWEPVAPTGTVYSHVTVHRRLGAPRWIECPYTVVVVDLDAGPRVVGLTPGAEVSIGDRVRIEPGRGGDEVHVAVVIEEDNDG